MEAAVKAKDAVGLVHAMKNAVMQVDNTAELVVLMDDKSALEATKALLQSALVAVNAQISEANKQTVSTKVLSGGDSLLQIGNMQCFEPRGRFDMKVTTSHIVLEGKQFSVLIPVDNVEQIIVLPSFTSAKKEGEDYLALQLKYPVKINNKDSTQLLLNLMRTTNPTTVAKSGYNDISESVAVVMAIQEATSLYAQRPQSSLFATCRDQKPYLKCYRGTQEGAIYPLQCGVVFIKPLLIIPADQIASLSAGRGGGAGNTRYVDLLIESTEEKTHEFTNIDREELPALQLYVKGYLEARAAKAAKALKKQPQSSRSGAGVKVEDGVVDVEAVDGDGNNQEESSDQEEQGEYQGRDLYATDSSDDEDDDYDPNASDSDGGRGGRSRKHHRRERDAASGSEGSSDASDSDSDDSDDSGSSGSGDRDSGSEESDASECSGDEEVRSPPRKQQAGEHKKHKPPAGKVKQAAGKEKKVKAGTKVKDEWRAEPGQAAPRPVIPGIPAVTATTGGLVKTKSEASAVKKEGRKPAVTVKREQGVVKHEGVRAQVKSEPAGAPTSAGIRDAEVEVVEVKREAAPVVDLTAMPQPTVQKFQARVPGSAAPRVPPATAVTPAATASGSGGAAPSAGVKRTIVDMFAAQKKPAVAVTPASAVKVDEDKAAAAVQDLTA